MSSFPCPMHYLKSALDRFQGLDQKSSLTRSQKTVRMQVLVSADAIRYLTSPFADMISANPSVRRSEQPPQLGVTALQVTIAFPSLLSPQSYSTESQYASSPLNLPSGSPFINLDTHPPPPALVETANSHRPSPPLSNSLILLFNRPQVWGQSRVTL